MTQPKTLTYAFCTFNRADRLEKLVQTMRELYCPIPFEILAINNNSQDHTLDVLQRLTEQPGPLLRVVTETQPGIVAARNRAITEAMHSDILVFIDDDELPLPGLLEAVVDAIDSEGAECVGGKIDINYPVAKPYWLNSDIEKFLGLVNHGDNSFWLKDMSKPIWSGNIAYAMDIFKHDDNLRFDERYSRIGVGIGGGEDHFMLERLLLGDFRVRYKADMRIMHEVEDWKVKPAYFLRLHYKSGYKRGKYQLPNYDRTILNVPPFLVNQFLNKMYNAFLFLIKERKNSIRPLMNAAFSLGCVIGYFNRNKLP